MTAVGGAVATNTRPQSKFTGYFSSSSDDQSTAKLNCYGGIQIP